VPRYHYECEECGFELLIRHSMKEKLVECPTCKEEALIRVMPNITLPTPSDSQVRVGSIVKSSIKEAREEMKKDLRQAQKEEYKS